MLSRKSLSRNFRPTFAATGGVRSVLVLSLSANIHFKSSSTSSSSSLLFSTQRFCSNNATTTPTKTATGKPLAINVLYSVTPNQDSLRFYSMELSFLPPGSTLDLPNEGHAYKCPLAEMLFKQCPGVASIYISDEYITVTKEPSASWDDLTPLVRTCIVEFAHSGLNILSDEGEQELTHGYPDTEPGDSDSEVVLAIKELLSTRIRPMLAADGGGLRFVAFEDGLVYLVLEGACKTCSSKGNTLKIGIERMLMHWVPEVAEVVEVDELWAEDYKRQFAEEKAKLAEAAEGKSTEKKE